MIEDDPITLLASAQEAYQMGDRRKGAEIIEAILQKDFNHRQTWETLYSYYGTGQPYEKFRKEFTQKFYPDKLSLLRKTNKKERSAVRKRGRQKVTKPDSLRTKWGKLYLSILSRLSSSYKGLMENIKAKAGNLIKKRPPDSQSDAQTSEKKPALPQHMEEATHHGMPGSLLRSAPEIGAANNLEAWYKPPHSPLKTDEPSGLIAPPLDESTKIRVMVVDDITQTRENVIRSLLFQGSIEVVGTATTGAQAIAVARETQPDVVLMDVNMPDMDGIQATSHIRREVTGTQVIILTVQDDVDYMRKAMLAGARDFLVKPPMIDELITAVQQASKIAYQERAASSLNLMTSDQMALNAGKIISIYSPKGGSGCSLLSTNLAIALHNPERQIALVDGNSQYGDIPVLLNSPGRFTILDLAPHSEELNGELIEEVLTLHESGIKLLAPPRPDQTETISDIQFTRILSALGRTYPYVIIDTPHYLGEVTLSALDSSDLVLLITTQDIPSIARTRKFLELSSFLNLDPQKIMIVLNAYNKSVNITPDAVNQALKHELTTVIPLENAVVIPSIQRGVPFMLQKEMSTRPIVKEISNLAGVILQRLGEQSKDEAGN